MRQIPPRAGTFVPGFRIKLPRKRGSGEQATKSTTRCSPEPSPGDLFAPFGSLQKGLAARRRRNPSKSKGTTQNRREGQVPPTRQRAPYESKRAATWGRPYKKVESTMWNQRRGQAPALRGYTIRERRAQWSRPTQTIIVACLPGRPQGAPTGAPWQAEGGGPPTPTMYPL